MRVTESERQFLHELHAIKKDPLGKRVIHFFVSQAPQPGDTIGKSERAKLFLEKAFAKSPYAKVFSANNGDIFVTYSHVTVSEVLAACSKIEKLFCDEHVVANRNAYNEYAFYKVADAGKDLDKVFAAFKSILAQAQPEPEAVGRRPMNPEHLSLVSDKLRSADVRTCIFNQPVYSIGHQVPSIEFLEFYVATRELENQFAPDVSLTGHPWLFAALREDMDRACLRTVAKEIHEYRHKSFSVNVALSTVLSREFAEFYDALPSRLAGKIILEVHKTDMVQHYGAMRDVAALAAEKGLKLCIDGLEWRDFDYLNLERIRPHFIKVGWSNDLLSSDPEQLAVFVQSVRRNPGTSVVMSRCDNPKAFPFARTLGVNYVQGKLADQMFKTGFKM